MGLNIGICVKVAQSLQTPPKLKEQFWQHLLARFPNAGTMFGCDIYQRHHEEYDFDIRFVHYGALFRQSGYKDEDVYTCIETFVREHVPEGQSMERYFLP